MGHFILNTIYILHGTFLKFIYFQVSSTPTTRTLTKKAPSKTEPRLK